MSSGLTPETQSRPCWICYADEHQIEVVRQTSRRTAGQTSRRAGRVTGGETNRQKDRSGHTLRLRQRLRLRLRLSDGWSVSFDVNVVTFIMSVRLRKQDETWLSPVHHLSLYGMWLVPSPVSVSVFVSVSVPLPFPPPSGCACRATLRSLFNKWLALCLGPNSLGVCIRWRVVSAPWPNQFV